MLTVGYDPALVFGAALVALMAAFTGLQLTHGIGQLAPQARRAQIVKAAIVLGGGVWSTHFVAMLALSLPVAIFYDAVATLASALIAVLLAGVALLVLHGGARTGLRVGVAGAILGAGVATMHYVGMSGLRGCAPVFAPAGVVASGALAVGMGVGALRLASGAPTRRAMTLGAVVFAGAILAMHFTAMAGTGFVRVEPIAARPGLFANEVLALFVVVAAFLICGAFLLTTATLADAAPAPAAAAEGAPQSAPTPAPPPQPAPDPAQPLRRVPYEQDGRTYFAAPEEIVAIQAEGHYTRLHRADGALFCPLAIARLESALASQNFLRTHRSYLVNLSHVRGFERRKDQGVCLFDPKSNVPPVPVSRARVAPIMKALGL